MSARPSAGTSDCEYLSVDDVVQIIETFTAAPLRESVRDMGLLIGAVERPTMRYGGRDVYPNLPAKAAVLMESLARNNALFDGNKRLAWLATYVFLAKNGVDLDPDDDAAYVSVVAVAAGEIDDVGEIATVLASWRAGV